MVEFKATKDERETIRQIAERYHAKRLEPSRSKGEVMMDVEAAHSNGCPLDLPRLLSSSDFDFLHDMTGIEVHLDRRTGNLTDCFTPRCARVRRVV